MRRLKIVPILVVLMTVFMWSFAYAGTVGLPKTGQTTSYGTRDDGALQRGVAWPSPRFTDNNNGTITDNLTGLIWLKNANCFGVQTWANALDLANALAHGSCGLTDNSNAGDWRLPNRKELRSLINYGQANQASWLNTQGFSNVQADYYWSSTTHAYYTDYAWVVYMYGYMDAGDKTYSYYVWPVRAGQSNTPNPLYSANVPKTGQTTSYGTRDDGALQRGVAWPSPRFTDNGNGTITDNLTGLIWLKNANCSANLGGVNKTGPLTWADALTWTNALASGYCGLADGSTAGDWRLPNVNELESLVHAGQANIAVWLNTQGFSNVLQAYNYWSSTTYALYTGYAWGDTMFDGDVFVDLKTNSHSYVWPVRAGSGSLVNLVISKSGTGSGTVTSSPAGINCGSTCTASFNTGTAVTLTATAASNSTFAGWSGACSGTGTCTLTMDAAKSVTATFNIQQCSYSINPTSANVQSAGGSGSVSVVATPSGCSGSWTAVSNANWITITSGSSGTGNGTVSYSVSANTSTSTRTGTITIAGQTFTVTQSSSSASNIAVTLSQVDTTQCPIVKGYVTVRDSNGNPITGLTESNFTVKEDGVVITPITVSTVGTVASSIAIAMTLDYSGSMSNTDVSNMENAAVTFINMMGTADAMEIIKFATTVSVTQQFTQDKTILANAVRQSWSGRGGTTAYYDAVYKGLQDIVANTQYARKAILAMTDGIDNESAKTLTQVIDYARANGIPIYTIGFGSVNRTVLESMARDTGGMYYYAPDSSGLQAIYNSIANTLNNQYIVSYTSRIQDGQQHDMEVLVNYQGQTGSDNRQFVACGSSTRYSLTVTKSGTGSGTVTSSPSGINCGSSCSATYGASTTVVLTAVPTVSTMSVKWEGDCATCVSGNSCQVIMNGDKSCVVKFLQVSTDGCYSVDISPIRFGSAGGTGQIRVNKLIESCPDYEWYVNPDVNFILFPVSCTSGVCDMSYGSGVGKVDNLPFKVLANSGSTERIGKLSFTMLSSPVEISQEAGSCTNCGVIFNDVDVTHWAKNYIYSIGCAGITQGCGINIYCPTLDVTREQMAAFIVRAKEGNPPVNYCGGVSPFNDVGVGDTLCSYIKRLSELQITQGCGGGNYCPKYPVTRGQMAAFIVRAKYGENFTYTMTPYFSDVPANHVFFKYVQKLKDEGITTVTGTYNVDSSISRAEMAAMLYRAFLQQSCGVLSVVQSGVMSYDDLFQNEIGER